MGKNSERNKRKREANSSAESAGDKSSDGNTSLVSSILSAASHVLYGAPTGSSDNGTLNGMATSTPKPSVRVKTGSDGSVDVMAMFTETNRKLDSVLEKLGKLDTIEANLGKLTSDVSNLEARVKSLEGSANDYGESLDFMSNQIDDLNEKHVNMDNVTKELKRHATMIETMSRSLEAVRRERGEISEKVTDLQWRSMKTNLVFTGLGKESNDEDTEDKLRISIQ